MRCSSSIDSSHCMKGRGDEVWNSSECKKELNKNVRAAWKRRMVSESASAVFVNYLSIQAHFRCPSTKPRVHECTRRLSPFCNNIRPSLQDCGKPYYVENYNAFYTALKEAYPELTLIANCDMGSGAPTELWTGTPMMMH